MDTALWQETPRDGGTWIIGHTRRGTPVFAVAGAEGGDPPKGDPPPADPPKGDPPKGDPPADPKPEPPKGGGDPDKGFTQDDVDRVVKDRLARERQKYADYGDLKKKAEEFDKLQDAQKTELQRSQDAASQAQTAAEQARADLQEERTRNAVFKAAAGEDFKITDLDAAYKLVDRSLIDHDDDGRPTEESVKAALKKLVEERPYLTASARPQGSGDGGPRGDPSDATDVNAWLRRGAGMS